MKARRSPLPELNSVRDQTKSSPMRWLGNDFRLISKTSLVCMDVWGTISGTGHIRHGTSQKAKIGVCMYVCMAMYEGEYIINGSVKSDKHIIPSWQESNEKHTWISSYWASKASREGMDRLWFDAQAPIWSRPRAAGLLLISIRPGWKWRFSPTTWHSLTWLPLGRLW